MVYFQTTTDSIFDLKSRVRIAGFNVVSVTVHTSVWLDEQWIAALWLVSCLDLYLHLPYFLLNG